MYVACPFNCALHFLPLICAFNYVPFNLCPQFVPSIVCLSTALLIMCLHFNLCLQFLSSILWFLICAPLFMPSIVCPPFNLCPHLRAFQIVPSICDLKCVPFHLFPQLCVCLSICALNLCRRFRAFKLRSSIFALDYVPFNMCPSITALSCVTSGVPCISNCALQFVSLIICLLICTLFFYMCRSFVHPLTYAL